MKIHQTIAALIAVAALDTSAVQAQTGNLFKVQINLTCRPPQEGGKNKMTAQTLIKDCVGDGFSNKQLNHDFKLVFNADADSLQVVNSSDGSVVCDVFQFGNATNVVGNSQLQRLTFVFVPNSTDAVGSAVMTEKASGNNKVKINGKIQFVRGNLTPNPETSVSVVETTNVTGEVVVTDVNGVTDVSGVFIENVTIAATPNEAQICSGTFTVGGQFIPTGDTQSNTQSTKLTRKQRRQQAAEEAAASGDGTITNTVQTATGTSL